MSTARPVTTAAILVVGAVVLTCAGASTARAQDRGYQGVFEGSGNDSARKTFGASLAVAGGYDHLSVPGIGALEDQFQLPGFFATLAPTAVLQSKGPHLNLMATAGTNGRYYGEARRLVAVNHYATANIDAQLTNRTNLFVGQSISYSPAYLNRLFSTLGPSPEVEASPTIDLGARAADDGLSRTRSYASGITVNLSRKFGRRTILALTSGGRYTRFVEDTPEIPDLRGLEGGGFLSFSANKDLNIRLAYQYREARYSDQNRSAEHIVDLGFSSLHRWSRTRRTSFAVSAGPRVLQQTSRLDPRRVDVADPSDTIPAVAPESIVAVGPPALSQAQVSVVGRALIDHQLGQSWTIHAEFHRDVAYLEGLLNPVFTNTLDLSVGGYVTRRIDMAVAFGRSHGDSTFSTAVPSPFRLNTGNARLRLALGKKLAVYGEGILDDYQFASNAPIPPGLSRAMSRTGVRGGLMLWVPVLRRR